MKTGKKYIFFDIDGTLTSHTKRNHILDSTFLALEKLREEGHCVFLATGRAVYLTKDIMQLTGINSLVCEGGNGVIISNELVSYEPIDQSMAYRVIERCDEIGLAWGMSNSDDPTIITRSELFVDLMNSIPFVRELIIDKKMDHTKRSKIRRILIENKPELFGQIEEIEKIGLMAYGKSPFAIIEPDDKYKGITKVLSILGGSDEDVIVFGDGLNDVKMFKQAACSVAMGNADEKLKAIATYVTDDADSDGIYNACINLGLIK